MPDVITKYYVVVEVVSGATALECKNDKDCDSLFEKLKESIQDETTKFIIEGNNIFAKDKITRIYKTKMEKKYNIKVDDDEKKSG